MCCFAPILGPFRGPPHKPKGFLTKTPWWVSTNSKQLAMGHNLWRSHFGADEHPCATYVELILMFIRGFVGFDNHSQINKLEDVFAHWIQARAEFRTPSIQKSRRTGGIRQQSGQALWENLRLPHAGDGKWENQLPMLQDSWQVIFGVPFKENRWVSLVDD